MLCTLLEGKAILWGMNRKGYPSDVSDEEWAFVAPYLTLMTEEAPQRTHRLREVYNGLRYVARGGIAWRMMPNDLPPWYTVYQQTQRWLKAGAFEDMVRDLRMLIREINDRIPQPRAAILDSRTIQSTPESRRLISTSISRSCQRPSRPSGTGNAVLI